MDVKKLLTVMVLLTGCGGGGGGGGGGSAPAETARTPGAYSPAEAETTQISSCPSEPIEKSVQIPEAGLSFYERITLAQDGQIEVYTTQAGFDTFCYLLDEQENTITSNDENGTDENCGITRSVPAGTYFVRVRAFNNLATGNFNLGTSCLGPFQSGETPTDGVAGESDLSFTLEWTHSGSTRAEGPDIDVWVVTPTGERLSTSRDGLGLGPDSVGGLIDRDDRGGWGPGTGGGPERVFWPVGAAPSGTYDVGVRYYEGDGNANFTLTLYRGDTEANVWIGTLAKEGPPIQVDSIVHP